MTCIRSMRLLPPGPLSAWALDAMPDKQVTPILVAKRAGLLALVHFPIPMHGPIR